jgi:DNA-binding Xre family transcriptional regulator
MTTEDPTPDSGQATSASEDWMTVEEVAANVGRQNWRPLVPASVLRQDESAQLRDPDTHRLISVVSPEAARWIIQYLTARSPLAKLAAARRLTLVELAERAGVAAEVIHPIWESRTIRINHEVMAKLAAALEVPVEALYDAPAGSSDDASPA